MGLTVAEIDSRQALQMVVRHHYLHRRTHVLWAYGLFDGNDIVGVVTFGIPGSRHLQKSACPTNPGLVVELNRLWVHDDCPRNTESFFLRRAMKLMPARIIVSFADTSVGHAGYVYRATGFKYAGWTDMERKTPRLDYLPPEQHTETLFGTQTVKLHSRDAFRKGAPAQVNTRRREPKVRYWEVTGNRRERRDLNRLVGWPSLSWKETPPPCQ